METIIYRIAYAIIVFTVRSSITVPSALTMSSLNLHCAHPRHVAAIPPSDVLLLLDNVILTKLLFPNCIVTNYI